MISLIITATELKELELALDMSAKYVGLYYSKGHPCLMYEIGDVTVAVQNKPELMPECKSIDYSTFNIPAWKQNMPDIIKHASKKRT